MLTLHNYDFTNGCNLPQETIEVTHTLNSDIKDLFVLGGDSRMDIDPKTGLNRYGCSPEPRNVFALSSCTASSPSPRAYGAATEMKYWLKLAAERGVLNEAVDVAFKRLRARLLKVFGLHNQDDIAVALTPSGTDVEILASALALGGEKDSRLCNIVAAPLEVGSGTVLAAGALNFDMSQPRSDAPAPIGKPIAQSISDRIEVISVPLRDDEGNIRTTSDLDGEVIRITEERVSRGERVLAHVVAHSKTGAHAPRLQTIKMLKEKYPDSVDVIIDAAQGRISRHGFAEAIDAGYMVLFTGSKFFCGPPFSGALFIPKSLWPNNQRAIELAAEAAQYFGAFEMPTNWPGVRELLPNKPNLGLIVRWTAAMAEIDAYYEIESADRMRVLREFEPIVSRTLLQSEWVTRFNIAPPMPIEESRLLESNTTVISFAVSRQANSQEYFGSNELRTIYHWLNQDMSYAFDNLEGEDATAIENCFQIGQPVLMSSQENLSILRVALGSAMIVTMIGNNTFGPNFDGRMLWFEHQFEYLRRKLELLAANYDRLAALDSVNKNG